MSWADAVERSMERVLVGVLYFCLISAATASSLDCVRDTRIVLYPARAR